MRTVLAGLSFLLILSCRSSAPPPSVAPALVEEMRSVMTRADVDRGFQAIDRERDAIIAQWRSMTEIPAPSGHEARRAEEVERLLRTYGLTDIRRDAVGNVMGTRRGNGSGHRVIFDAHLDTVFPLTTDVTTRIENGRMHAPGVGENTRNVVALLAMIRAMNAGEVETAGDITFLFTVEEETSFRGVDHFISENKEDIDRFVALDGGHIDFTYGGTGIYWHRYHILGPGGHTRSATPPYSAALPVARAIERIYSLKVPDGAWLNVGMLGGTDVFNAKAPDAWFSVDLRSIHPETLQRLDTAIQKIVAEEAGRAGMTTRRDVESTEEVASLPGHRSSEMVLATEAIYRAFGFDPSINPTASNHTSAAIRAGIPAVGVGTAPCEGAHAIHENCEIEPIFTGIKRLIVMAVVLSE